MKFFDEKLNKEFDSELERNYYLYLKEKGYSFYYQDKYKKTPLHINLGRRKNYTPDFLVFDEKAKVLTIIECKGYAKWSANEDNNIMDFMNNKVLTDKEFLYFWLEKIIPNAREYTLAYKRIKYLKSIGFVDYNFKNPNSLLNQKRNKIVVLEKENKELKAKVKDLEKYFKLSRQQTLTKVQKAWLESFENSYKTI